MKKWLLGIPAVVGSVAAADLLQKSNPVLRNFPVAGHARQLLTALGPELRQYIVASNDEERPFTRDHRNWIYESAAGVPNTFGFGTDDNIEYTDGYPLIKHRPFATHDVTRLAHVHGAVEVPSGKVLGGPRGRAKAFRPASIVNVSAMSYGALSGRAVESLNRGCAGAGAMQNTGEGGLSTFHQNGADLIFQIGTGYFGVRDDEGHFDLDKLVALVERNPIRAIEIKLSQGAKPGLGGVLPGSKVTAEIAQIRSVPEGKTVVSPSRHSAFHDTDSMVDFVERVAAATGLPVGIKSAVGDLTMFQELADIMATEERGVDFITIDGGEGGTGAAPLTFTDSVSLPFRLGFSRAYSIFARAGVADRITFIGSGKLGIPTNAAVAFGLGVDMINVAREGMLSIGCIQAQKCHTGGCPSGVATNNPWLAHGVDPDTKSLAATRYLRTLRSELLSLSCAVGVMHPAFIGPTDIEIASGTQESQTLVDVYGYEPTWGLPDAENAAEIARLMELTIEASDHITTHA